MEDEKWLQNTNSSSWVVFHSQSKPIPPCQDTSVMLPILRDDSKSPATIKHLLNVLIQSIYQLNPNQTAVIGFDQPLYPLAKKIQWFQPAIYGQQNLVLMLGVLHIKMVLLSCLGGWLQDSGWMTAVKYRCYIIRKQLTTLRSRSWKNKVCPSSNCFDITPIDERCIRAKQEGRLHFEFCRITWIQGT